MPAQTRTTDGTDSGGAMLSTGLNQCNPCDPWFGFGLREQRALFEDAARSELEAAPGGHGDTANLRLTLRIDEHAVFIARQVIGWRHVPQHHVGVGDGPLLARELRQAGVVLLVPLVRRDPEVELRELLAAVPVARRARPQRQQLVAHLLALAVQLARFDAQARELLGLPRRPAFDAVIERLDDICRLGAALRLRALDEEYGILFWVVEIDVDAPAAMVHVADGLVVAEIAAGRAEPAGDGAVAAEAILDEVVVIAGAERRPDDDFLAAAHLVVEFPQDAGV